MSEASADRRWGIMRVSEEFNGLIDEYLPSDHKIIASRKHQGFDEHIIEGPNMPSKVGPKIDHVTVLLFVDDSGASYAYWDHMQARRWLLPPGLWPCSVTA